MSIKAKSLSSIPFNLIKRSRNFLPANHQRYLATMPAELKPISLYGGALGPNPSKVAAIFAELSLAYDPIYIPMNEVKGPRYTAVNPNGRLPAITDPNNANPNFTLWESGAIIEYLAAKYDTENLISFEAGSEEDWMCKQWLYFQVTGQGPYYGQGYWFKNHHPEKIQSAIDRYAAEIKRVTGVLDKVLEGKTWLVGEKCTYADLAFIPWQESAPGIVSSDVDLAKEFPNVQAWMERMKARPAVKKTLEEYARKKAEVMAARAAAAQKKE